MAGFSFTIRIRYQPPLKDAAPEAGGRTDATVSGTCRHKIALYEYTLWKAELLNNFVFNLRRQMNAWHSVLCSIRMVAG